MSNKTQLSARERINALLDDSSFVEIGAYVTARSTDFNMQEKETEADGVVTGYGSVDGKLVYVYSQDKNVLCGSIGEMHAKKISKIYDMAVKMGAPVVGLIDCAGLRLQEAADGLNAFGEIYLKQTDASGVIPQITGIFGSCGGGAALIPALTDFTFMTKEDSKLFVNSPNALDGNYASKLDTADAGFQSEVTGLADVVCEDELAVLGQMRELVSLLPACNDDETSFAACTDDLNRIIPNLDTLADNARDVLVQIGDNNQFFEIKKEYAKDMVLGFIRLNGVTVGCVGNQAEAEGNMLTTNGAMAAAEFVTFCDAFNIPVLSLTNVKGYKATVEEEKTIAKAVAKLTYAFANATVPKVNLVMGDAFGSAYTAMNSKSIGADVEFAWNTAKIGMMDSEAAVAIMYADELANAKDKKAFMAEKKKEYTDLQASPIASAKRGYVDDIIEADATRKRLIAAFEMLLTKRDERPFKKHGAV